ncbi:hypothetical protein GCM10028795_29060 [Lysobacter olei]
MMFNNIISPLEQFEIKDFFSLNINIINLKMSLTNFGFYIIISTIIILTLHLLITYNNKLISNS